MLAITSTTSDISIAYHQYPKANKETMELLECGSEGLLWWWGSKDQKDQSMWWLPQEAVYNRWGGPNLFLQLSQLPRQVGHQPHGRLQLLLQVPDLILFPLRVTAHQGHGTHSWEPIQVVLLVEHQANHASSPRIYSLGNHNFNHLFPSKSINTHSVYINYDVKTQWRSFKIWSDLLKTSRSGRLIPKTAIRQEASLKREFQWNGSAANAKSIWNLHIFRLELLPLPFTIWTFFDWFSDSRKKCSLLQALEL